MATDTLFREKAPSIMALLMADFGLDAESAAAILGNLGHESGGFRFLQEKQPLVPGSEGGWGWAQWTGPRRDAFEAYVERNSLDPAGDKANYGWLWVELKGPEAKAIPAVKAAADLYSKVVAFEMAFERAGVKHYDSRLAWANKALVAFHAAGDPAAVIPAQEVLSPLAKIDTSALAPLFNALLPVLLQALAARAQGATGAQPGQGIDLQALLAQLAGGLAPQAAAPPVPPPAPAPVVVTAAPKPSVGLGLLGLFGSAIGMATGAVGTPFGMGAEPTTAGTLSLLIPAAISAVGATGIFGPFGAIFSRVAGAAFTAAKAPKT